MTERHQIRVNVPDAMFKKLEGDARSSGFSLPAYVQHLLLLQCDDRANWLTYTSAYMSLVTSRLFAFSMDGAIKNPEHMDKALHKAGMLATALIGDPPRPPEWLQVAEDNWDEDSFALELSKLVARFSSVGFVVRRDERRKRCPVCERSLPWG